MADVYTVGQVGIEFAARLTNNDNPWNIVPVDLDGYDRVYVRFFRPDGTTFTRDAEPRDADSLDDTDILFDHDGDYDGSDDAGLLDMRGDWSYAVGAEFGDGTVIESAGRRLFYVV